MLDNFYKMTFIWIGINSNNVPFNESNWTLSVVKDDVKLAHAAAKFFEDDDGFSMKSLQKDGMSVNK